MIRNFPAPYPDELFCSLLARYYDRMGYTNKQIMQHYYFSKNYYFPYCFLPKTINALIHDLPTNHPLSTKKIIYEHSIFPYMGIFLDNPRYEKIVMKLTSGTYFFYKDTGFLSQNPFTRMKYCPICRKEDISKYGETYWHRIHQCPGIVFCHKHNIMIENSDIILSVDDKYPIPSAERSINNIKYRSIRNINKSLRNILLHYIGDVEWILNKKENIGIDKYNELLHN